MQQVGVMSSASDLVARSSYYSRQRGW